MPYKLDAMSDRLEELTAARSAVLALEESDPAHEEAVLRLLKAEAAAGETFRGGSWCAVQPTRSRLACPDTLSRHVQGAFDHAKCALCPAHGQWDGDC